MLSCHRHRSQATVVVVVAVAAPEQTQPPLERLVIGGLVQVANDVQPAMVLLGYLKIRS